MPNPTMIPSSEPESYFLSRTHAVASRGADIRAIDSSTAPLIVYPASLKIGNPIFRRESIRPPELRGTNFTDQHDDSTLFFDAFYSLHGDRVVLVGPPFHNLTDLVEESFIIRLPSAHNS